MIEDKLKTDLNSLIVDLRQALAQNNVNASGSLSQSLESKVLTKGNKIIGQVLANRYIDTVDTGRAPNKNNTGGLLEAIKEWLKYGKYGLPNTLSVAYAITRNIAKLGSYLYRNKIDRKIVESVVSETRIAKIVDALANEYVIVIEKQLIDIGKKLK